GIIENYQALKKELSAAGFKFASETDTETIPNLIEQFMGTGMEFPEAVRQTAQKLEGRYAFLALAEGFNGIIAARNGSPLVAGIGAGNGTAAGESSAATYIASDIPAFLQHTKSIAFLDDGEMVIAQKGRPAEFLSIEGNKNINKRVQTVDWSAEEAEKGNFPHFMIKEITEQQETILRAVNQGDEIYTKASSMINGSFGTFLVGCGTAGRVALCGTYLFSKIANKHVNFSVGSEFPNYEHFLTDKTLMIPISQSGETADTLEAIEKAKARGVKVLSIVNVPGSSISRKSDFTIPVNCGPEKAVASTKATTSQLAILTLLAYGCAGKFGEGKKLLADAQGKINKTIFTPQFESQVRALAEKIKSQENIYIIGRGLNYPMALESAIKLQEVPYIHAEGFAGGELKHGPIALIEKGTPCIALVANDETKSDILSNAMEVKSRGGFIIGISPEPNEIFDVHLPVPDLGNASPITNIIPVQMLSYHLAVLKGNDVDCPRNLAKSVTVK
ncbi:glutamine--fructose-6-phosphate transaminase (isomerizing), partial [Candidatus Micrarchaeota archaeon]|nr:glutamine--fructose-6-phosphate transaminase (isomerizing) [Candidatus Micrarchaeota archaeon]